MDSHKIKNSSFQKQPTEQLPQHGGGLNDAIKQYGNDLPCLEKEFWLDLSTGVNPKSWPVPEIPASVYNRLPEKEDGLIEIAQTYYRASNILPVAGSQEAIQLLPMIFQQYSLFQKNNQANTQSKKQAKVGIITPCYSEHEFQWKKNNFSVVHLTTATVDMVIDELDVLVLINPNNPTGEVIEPSIIKGWQAQLNDDRRKSKGYLIVDEAFMDATPENNMPCNNNMQNLIVLRSVGKFFGLAGIRCGFVIAHPSVLSLIEYHQGPWSVSGPTRWMMKKAFRDKQWIIDNKVYLNQASMRLEKLLKKHLKKKRIEFSISGTVLFKTIYFNSSEYLFKQLAKQGVLVRLLDKSCTCPSCTSQFKTIKEQHKGIRFGLPSNEKQWCRLETVLDSIDYDLPCNQYPLIKKMS